MGSGASAGLSLEDDGAAPCRAQPWERVVGKGVVNPWVMIDVEKWKAGGKGRGTFEGELWFGFVSQKCASLDRKNMEYTVAIEANHTVVVEGKYIRAIDDLRNRFPEMASWSKDWIHFGSPTGRDVAVVVETHNDKKFLAELIRLDARGFEVQFKSDNFKSNKLTIKDNIREPDGVTEYKMHSPFALAPDNKWLLDRKIQEGIDKTDPQMLARKGAALQQLRKYRPSSKPPLCGPFIGKGAIDSEHFPGHPTPPADLKIDGPFVDTWAKFCGKVKFAQTPKIGPTWPKSDAWVESIDASDALYFHAALPVYAGLICLGEWGGPGLEKPEFVRASDVALVGIALYANGELFEGSFTDPPIERLGMTKYRHEACQYVPGCVSTYSTDSHWMGSVFCLAPDPHDDEVRDDIFTIRAYHDILKQCVRKMPPGPNGEREVVITVNLILSTNFLANVRQVCSGGIHVKMNDRSCAIAADRIRNVNTVRYHSQAALAPKRHRKDGSGKGVGQLKLSQGDLQEDAEHKIRSTALRDGSRPLPQAPPPESLLNMEAHWGVVAHDQAAVYDPKASPAVSQTGFSPGTPADAKAPPPPPKPPAAGERFIRQELPGRPAHQAEPVQEAPAQGGKAPPPPPSAPHPSKVRLRPAGAVAAAPHSPGLGLTAGKPAPPPPPGPRPPA